MNLSERIGKHSAPFPPLLFCLEPTPVWFLPSPLYQSHTSAGTSGMGGGRLFLVPFCRLSAAVSHLVTLWDAFFARVACHHPHPTLPGPGRTTSSSPAGSPAGPCRLGALSHTSLLLPAGSLSTSAEVSLAPRSSCSQTLSFFVFLSFTIPRYYIHD